MDFPEEKTEKEQRDQKVNITSIVMFVMLIILMLAIAFTVYLKSSNVDIRSISVNDMIQWVFKPKEQKNIDKQLAEIEYDSKERPVFGVYKDYIVKCTRDNLIFMDKNGEIQWEKGISVNNPMIKATGSDFLVADIGAKEIYLVKDKEIKWNKKAEGNILNIDMSESGHVSIVHEAKGYKGAVTVYNLQGGPFFTRNIAESFVVSAGVSPSAKQVVINSLDASGVKSDSILEFTDILGKPTASKIIKENTILASARYLNNDLLVAVGDSSLICFDKNGKEKWKHEYPNRKIYSSDISMGKSVVLAVSGEDINGIFQSSSSEVRIYNQDGHQAGVFNIEDEIRNIETYQDYIAVNTGREVYFINNKGKLEGKYSTNMDITAVSFLSKKEAVIITKTKVIVIEIN